MIVVPMKISPAEDNRTNSSGLRGLRLEPFWLSYDTSDDTKSAKLPRIRPLVSLGLCWRYLIVLLALLKFAGHRSMIELE